MIRRTEKRNGVDITIIEKEEHELTRKQFLERRIADLEKHIFGSTKIQVQPQKK
jgi:hypothetical protein